MQTVTHPVFVCVRPLVREGSMASGAASVECSSKPTPPKTSDPAPSASPAAAAVQSPPPKDESKKKKPEKKGNSWRKS